MATTAQTTRPLSERLSDLSRRAKAVEDAFATARTETKQKLDAPLDQARSSVEQLKHEIQLDASSANEEAKSQWQDLQTRFTKRIEKVKADVNAQKEQFAADRATLRADLAEDDASAAVDDALGALEYARYAVLYAAATRVQAESIAP
jgi:HD-GYP domain-containing protein (c-di-GMP phosphodiesterase class II)